MPKLALVFLILASPFLLFWAPFDLAQDVWLLMYAPYALVMLGVLYWRPLRELKLWILLVPVIFVLLSVTLLPLWFLGTQGTSAATGVLVLSLTWAITVAPIVGVYAILCALLLIFMFRRFGWLDDAT